MTEEKWQTVFGTKNYYEVSDHGHVRSIRSGRILTPHATEKGHLKVGLSVDGETLRFYVHRLVAIAFIPNPKALPQVNHIDLCKSNNHVTNLEWCDHMGNFLHSYVREPHKYQPPGGGKLTAEQVVRIKARHAETGNATAVAREFGLNHSVVSRIIHGERWRHAHLIQERKA